jgi:P-type Ca2+ transporter type 2C
MMTEPEYNHLRRDTEFHKLRPSEVLQSLQTSPQGLSSAEAARRLERFGRNVIRSARKKPLYLKLLANFTHLMAILLWAAGAMAFVGGMPELGWAIWCVVVINAAFSFWQEFRAERAVEALRRLLPPQATVVRDGEERLVMAEELVPGDIMVVTEGDKISADGRVVEESELRVDQSTLSGESHPARKTADPIQQQSLSRTELPNLVFAGTTAASGSGRAVVIATGMETEFGRIAHLTTGTEEAPSPLQLEINRMTRLVTYLAIGIGVVFFVLSITVMQRPAHTGFIFAIGMVVAFVPEGLLPTVTLSLAMAVQRMARRNALVKKLSSVESLGCCNVICTDKTGTLTQNEMTVRELWVARRRLAVSSVGYAPVGELVEEGATLALPLPGELRRLLVAAGLCNDARVVPPEEAAAGWKVIGDPTEAALKVVAAKGGVDLTEENLRMPRLRELPFDSVRKRMSSIHREREGETAFLKGAPKEVLSLCSGIMLSGRVEQLTPELRGEVLAANDGYARDGYRVLAVAERRLPADLKDYSPESVEKDLVLLGLTAMQDPARPEVASAVQSCHRAGIRIIMLTGDYGLTAESIARRIGIIAGSAAPRLITGSDLDALDDAQLQAALADQVIFARVAPQHKLRVVQALQALKLVVAVTGDGVNDAPALKKADIGVAMGMSGTDVAKEAADMILMDDNFASIVSAVEEGRAVYANIKKFTTYIFSSNVTEAFPFILQIMFNIPLALIVMQVLAIDLGTDMVPALALGTEAPEPDIMDRPPRSGNDRLMNRSLLLRALWLGSLETILCFAGFFVLYRSYGYTDLLHLPRVDLLPYAQRLATRDGQVYILATSIFLAGVVCAQVGNAYACRTERIPVFSVGFFSNRFLLVGIAFELLLCSMLMYLPALRPFFEVGPLPLKFWGLLVIFTILMFLAEEGRKALLRRRDRSRGGPGAIPGGAS